jgi:hypothetical protein
VIGDDVSGRVPSLLVWDQMQRWAHHRNVTAPQMYFVAGGRLGLGSGFSQEARMENLATRLEEEGLDSHSGRAVILSEIVNSGESMKPLVRALERHKIPYDVAAMSSSLSEDTLRTRLGASTDVKVLKGSDYGLLYLGGPNLASESRKAVGVEKYGDEATSRPNRQDTAAVSLLRKEIAPLSRFTFEKVFQ